MRSDTDVASALGIDLGTTNSVVAVLEGGEPTVIANSEGSRTTPSVVAFARNGEVLVGQSAKNQAVTNVDRTLRSVKRHIGTGWSTPDIDGKRYTAQEISARVLQKLKRDAWSRLGWEITDAVITVPAYFDTAMRWATEEAGRLAGLNVIRLVDEPIAAALAYGLNEGDRTILVLHLGGGSTSATVVDVGRGAAEVRAVGSDLRLGGDDWDDRIAEWLVERFRSSNGIDLSKDKMAMQRVREAAEKAKIELSSQERATVSVPYVTVDADKNPLFLDETLWRGEFQRITRDLLDRTRAPFNRVIKDAGISMSRIDHVVLVGGATRMPAFVELVRELTGGKEPETGLNPDETAAVGAVLCGQQPDRVAEGFESDVTGATTSDPAVPPSAGAAPRVAVRSGVFVCYRTVDAGATAGRLAEKLSDRLGEDRVFIDVESVQPGVDYREAVRDAIDRTRVMLVVIGDRWLAATDRRGRPRLMDEDDTLRIEIEYALDNGVTVVPVLVDGAPMPPRHELPASLGRLTTINSLFLGTRTWRRDAPTLLDAVVGMMAH
jgi:actin-like ATPase involved in cell morphogenesis